MSHKLFLHTWKTSDCCWLLLLIRGSTAAKLTYLESTSCIATRFVLATLVFLSTYASANEVYDLLYLPAVFWSELFDRLAEASGALRRINCRSLLLDVDVGCSNNNVELYECHMGELFLCIWTHPPGAVGCSYGARGAGGFGISNILVVMQISCWD